MRPLLALVALLLATSAQAQQRQPANVSTLPTTNPQEFDLLDNTGKWIPFFGHEIDLTSFGAKCDGSADDTAAIQNWLNTLAPNAVLTAPAGVCVFSSPLTAPFASSWTIRGSGPKTTVFKYVGANTAVDLLTISDTSHGGETGVALRDFSILSATTMTGGFALHAHGLFSTTVSSVWLDSANNFDASTAGKLCGGFWLDGAGGVSLFDPKAFSQQNCGDGLRVNAALGGSAEVPIFGGSFGGMVNSSTNVVSGFVNGLHMAGGFGGLRCDSTNIHGSLVGVLIDQSVTGTNNREFDEGSTCAVDSNQNAGVQINDAIDDRGAVVDLAGWNAGTQQGPGVLVSRFGGTVNLRGDMLYLNCGDGIDIEDPNVMVLIAPTLQIHRNGHLTGTGCTAWSTAHPGHGWGVYAGVANAYTFNWGNTLSNAAGPVSPNVYSPYWDLAYFAGTGTRLRATTPSLDNEFGLDAAQAGRSSVIQFMDQGVDMWSVGRNNLDGFSILDVANGASAAMTITTPGVVVLGESNPGSHVTVASVFGIQMSTWADNQLCNPGMISVDANYIYVCTAASVVKRVALSAF